MHRNTTWSRYAAVAAVCSLGLIGTAGGTAQAGSPSQVRASPPLYLDTSYSFQERSADLVSRMSLEEKALQLRTNSAPAIPRLASCMRRSPPGLLQRELIQSDSAR